jgi:hypothetical protein
MPSHRQLFAALAAALLSTACHTGSANTMVGAATMTSLAVGAAAVNRASGGCIAACVGGTGCNARTGLCEPLPCRGQCQSGERCADDFTGGRCVPGTTGVAATAQGTGVQIPVAAPASATDSSGPPIVVPKAEQQPPSQSDPK